MARLLHKVKEAEKVREMLAGFYGQMKDRTEKIRFLMITGVSKFTKMSVFSALSNLVDLTFEDSCATMFGYTEEGQDKYFGAHMHNRAELKRWFNGYRFGKFTEKTVYHPVSIGRNLYSSVPMFQPWWAETGKASTLVNNLKRPEYLAVDLDNVKGVPASDFDTYDLDDRQTVPMLFQTGYLTIDDFYPETLTFDLRVPDEEIRQDISTVNTAAIADQGYSRAARLGKQLLFVRWPEFFTRLKVLYAGMPYGPEEGAFQAFSYERVLITLFQSQCVQVKAEDRQSKGRADIVAPHSCGIYIFELKGGKSEVAALAQVKAKGYDAPYGG